VRVKNTATGAVRTWIHAPAAVHFAWGLSMCMYTFIGCIVASSSLVFAGILVFAAWEVFFALALAAVWYGLAYSIEATED
jgi:hypothetical protein